MKNRYRAVAYYGMNGIVLTSSATTRKRASETLDLLSELDQYTGGHIEKNIDGVGWTLSE